jgi:Carboxypeptidase regulatory-like domain/TonB-dependent Receptor Plug Domain
VRIATKLVLSWAAFTFALSAFGQGITTGTITGTVTDPSGAVVPGAQIQITDLATDVKLDQKAAADGSFKFFIVPIGTYSALVTANGFANENIANIQVVAGATTNLNEVKLQVASASSQVVEVNGSAAALLETSDSQVTTTFSTESMQSLPLNNGFDTVAELIPGVVGVGDDNFANSNGDNYSVNGQSSRYNNYEIDGQTNNDNSVGGTLVFFGSQEAIQQIQVITNQYSAQYGRNAGAVVNYITKSGTNSFHGSAFDLYQGQFLSSLSNSQKNPLFGFCPPGQNSNCLNNRSSPYYGDPVPALPRYVENRAGATVGGPIFRDKLFFFFSTYWDRVRPGPAPVESYSQPIPGLTPVPGSAGLGAIAAAFSSDPGAAAIAGFGPYSIAAGSPQPIPVPAGLCPAADTYTAAGTCLENVTDANGNSAAIQVAGVERTLASPSDDQEELARLDWQPTEKDRLFLRFYYQNQFSPVVAGPDGIAAGDWIEEPSFTYDIGADWTHTFTSNFIDQLRYSYQDSKVLFQGGAFPRCTVSDFAACPAQVNFTTSNDDSNFAGDADFPQGNTVKVTQVQDNATWTHGRQTLLFGGEFDYQNSPDTGIFFYNGYPIYGNLSNLMGAPSQGLINQGAPPDTSGEAFLAAGNLVVPFTEPDVAAYFQDDWKALPTLTLHLGLRWEFFSNVIDKLHSETVARESNPSTAFWNSALPLSVRTVPYIPQIYTNFEPRIGFAWNPDFDKKLVVSSGYAINANPVYYNLDLLVSDGAPVTNDGAFLCFTNACLPSNGSLLDADFRTLNLPSLPTGGDPGQDVVDTFPAHFRTPYVQSWTLGVQHQIGSAAVGEVRYVGSKTTDDFQSVDANPDLLSVASAFPNDVSAASLCSNPAADGYGRPNCNYGNLIETTNGGWANYNAVELNLTTQNYHGLTSTVSYTFSKAMNNATDGFRTNVAGGSTVAFSQNPLSTSVGERGLSGNDFPNTLGIGFTYDLPKLVKGESLLARTVNGFLLSGVYRYRSGQVYTPYQPNVLDGITGDTSFCDFAFNANVIGIDTCRLAVSNPKAPINTLAYLNPYTGPIVNGPNGPQVTQGTPEYVVYNSDSASFDSSGNLVSYNPGTPVSPANAHWIVNNQAYALSVNNPYPGWSRSLLRGQPFSELDATVFKTFPITERVNLQLSMAAYNALNQMFRGVGDTFIGAANFTSNAENPSGTVSGSTSGNRFVILGGKVVF